jgi:hypothetical protein
MGEKVPRFDSFDEFSKQSGREYRFQLVRNITKCKSIGLG